MKTNQPTFYEIKKKFDNLSEQFLYIGKNFSVESLMKEKSDLEKMTSEQGFWNNTEEARKIMFRITQITEKIEYFQKLEKNDSDLKELFEMVDESQEEDMNDLIDYVNLYSADFEQFLYSEVFDEMDSKNAIMTIHPGAGGTESTDWASMLLRMYTRYFEIQGFKYKFLDYMPNEGGGLKSATMLVSGKNAYGFLKNETGIHRLVRISPFDSNKRRHTSFSSVYCYPEIDEEISLDINPNDLKIDTFRAGGAGGQHVNTTDSAVRITHIPSGIVVSCQNERSQHKNKDMAMKILKSRLYLYFKEQAEQESQKNREEKKSIGWGNQIRSYVLHPYTLIKDHRTNYEKTNAENVFNGEINDFIFEMIKFRFSEKNSKNIDKI